MARIRKDGFPIRAIRAIRGKKSFLKWLSLRNSTAKEQSENGSQSNTDRSATLIGKANFFFAPLRLRAFALKPAPR